MRKVTFIPIRQTIIPAARQGVLYAWTAANWICQTQRYSGCVPCFKVHLVGRGQVRPLPTTGQTQPTNHSMASHRHSEANPGCWRWAMLMHCRSKQLNITLRFRKTEECTNSHSQWPPQPVRNGSFFTSMCKKWYWLENYFHYTENNFKKTQIYYFLYIHKNRQIQISIHHLNVNKKLL